MLTAIEKQEDRLRIYHGSAPSVQAINLARIARFFGVSADLIDLASATLPGERLDAQLSSDLSPSMWDVASLVGVIDAEEWPSIAGWLANSASAALILATAADERHRDILKILSQGAVTGVHPAGSPDLFRFPETPSRFSAQLSGQQYRRAHRDAIALQIPDGPGIETIADLGNGLPAFACLRQKEARLFFWSTLAVFDIDLPLARESEFELAVDEYIPAIIFLRSAFGERCWHSPGLDADIIIDDPLLEPRYGFIDFPELLSLATQESFHVTLAFIPWNHWRTRREDLRGFLDYPDSFGICAHGCDHISNEFRTSDYPDLLRRSHLAAERMDRHRQRTGMGWDPLMVCPREEYTLDAIRALADSGRYLGMVNTGCIPRDMDTKPVRGSDLLLPVQDAFFGFPLFKRHYWSDISVFAMAAFLGKPAILVEHHDFFQNNCRAVKDFVTQLAAICPAVRWTNLTRLATRTHALRRATPDTIEVRFFTDEFTFRNPDSEPRTIRFRRRLPLRAVAEPVTVNGIPVSCRWDGDFLHFEASIAGNGLASVRACRPSIPAPRGPSRGWTYGAGVALRRVLSEMRDNGRREARL